MNQQDEQRFLEARRTIIRSCYQNLNDMQQQAVMTTQGPLLLLAGAGSGKTTVLIHRIANLIRFGRASDSEDIPGFVTEEDVDLSLIHIYMMNQYAMNMQSSGFTLEQYAQMMGTTIQGLREQSREGAVQQIRNTLLLEKVAEEENIQVTDEELEEEYQTMAKEYDMEVEKVKEYLPLEDLRKEKQLQKAMDLIVDNAVATEPKAEETPAAE